MTIQIERVRLPGKTNGFGVGVHIYTDGKQLAAAPDGEGETWVGLCHAVNDHMRSVGAPDFDCLKPHGPNGKASA